MHRLDKCFRTAGAVAAALLTLSACSREMERNDLEEGKIAQIEAGLEAPATRVSFADDGAFSWSEGDAIALISGTETRTMTLSSGAGTARGLFEGDLSGITSSSAAVYPASAAKGAGTVTLPASYAFREGQTNAVLYADAPDLARAVELKHLGGIIKIVYESVPAEANALVLTADAGITGDFAVSDGVIRAGAAAGNEKVTVTFAAGSAPKAFYVPVPTGTFKFSVVLQQDGTDLEGTRKETSEAKTVARRTLLLMDPVSAEEPAAPYMHLSAEWFYTQSVVTSNLTQWTGSNRFYAQKGDAAGKAYISSFKGNAGSTEPVRTNDNNRLSVANITEGDGVLFTWPGLTVAKGSSVDFMTTVMMPTSAAPKYWIFEYEDGGTWKTVEEDLQTATEDPSLKYSFYVKYFSAYQYTTFSQSFTLENALNGEDLRVRIRAVGRYNGAGGTLSPSTGACLSFVGANWQSANIEIYQGAPVKDTRKILVLGNSFTYYNGTDFMLKEIARTQGHVLRMRAHLKGSQDFGNHLVLERSQNAVKEGGYDFALLQDQSTRHADYYLDPVQNASILNNTTSLVGQIKQYSPSVQPLVEATWAYAGSTNYNGFGSYEKFDKALLGGALLVTSASQTWMSPIGTAFEKARAEGIALYHTDNKHPALNGAYLKACVNYLLLFGEPFDANAPDCTVPAATAKRLRQIAEEVVLGDLQAYRNPDASAVVPGEGVDPGEEVDPDQIVPGENGIRTPAQLRSFASCVNSGADISSYCNASGEVVLLEDIELPANAWTPIGTVSNVAYGNAPVTPVSAFKGVFDGQGHTIIGLHLVVDSNQFNTMGFFGATDGATVRNVTFEDAVMTLNSSGISSAHLTAGVVAGYAIDTKFENVHVAGSLSGLMTSTAARSVAVAGLVGSIASRTDNAASMTDCSFEGTITNDIGTKYGNSESAVIGGIVGNILNPSSCKIVTLLRCVNNGTIDVKAHRVGGIVSTSTHGHIEACVNNGDITVAGSSSKASSSVAGCRVGGIMAYCTSTSANNYYLKDCVNNGTITVPEASSYVGGLAGLFRCYTATGCRNTGDVYAAATTRGLMVGCITSADSPSVFSDCAFRGRLGESPENAVEATEENYLSLGIVINGGSAPSWNADNVHFLAQ